MMKVKHPLATRLIAPPFAAEAAMLIDGKTPEERMAAHQAYCATMGLSSNEARAVMIPVAARVLVGRETDKALAKWANVADSVYQKSKARLDKWASDNNARNPFEKHALIHAYVICRDRQAIPSARIACRTDVATPSVTAKTLLPRCSSTSAPWWASPRFPPITRTGRCTRHFPPISQHLTPSIRRAFH